MQEIYNILVALFRFATLALRLVWNLVSNLDKLLLYAQKATDLIYQDILGTFPSWLTTLISLEVTVILVLFLLGRNKESD